MVALTLTLALSLVPAAQPDRWTDPGPAPVRVLDRSWHDPARDREVPVRIYAPSPEVCEADGPFPVVVFSHGMGGSRQGYAYFGRHLASHGYVVVHPTHAGSDSDAIRREIRERLRDAVRRRRHDEGLIEANTGDPDNLRNRPADVSFVLDRIAEDPDLGRFADTAACGVAGHSFGSYTAMACAGMLVDLPDKPDASLADPRVRAAIAMSPQGAGVMGVDGADAWDAIDRPILYITGTRDGGQGGRAYRWRLAPFQRSTRSDAFLIVLQDATHMTFSDRPPRAGETPRDPRHHRIVCAASTAFFDAFLKHDDEARAWFEAGAFAGADRDIVRFDRAGQ